MTLSRDDLYGLEEYATRRPEMRARVMEHKKTRRVSIGAHVTLHFEDRLTMQYQVQEMLRAERIFDPEGIQEELEAYNPMIPDGPNWKATMMIEIDNPEERRDALMRLRGVESQVWVEVGGHHRIWAIADEDLERQDETKTSAVHFLRFELTPQTIDAVKDGEAVTVGIDHPDYHYKKELPPATRESIARDLA